MGLVYLLEDWIDLIPGSIFENRHLKIKPSFDWEPLVMVISAAAARTLGIWIFKELQMKMHRDRKAFVDRV